MKMLPPSGPTSYRFLIGGLMIADSAVNWFKLYEDFDVTFSEDVEDDVKN